MARQFKDIIKEVAEKLGMEGSVGAEVKFNNGTVQMVFSEAQAEREVDEATIESVTPIKGGGAGR